MKVAPIILFTFNRLDHTKKTIESLKRNTLASQSELYIFNDGPRNEEEKKFVIEVRNYISTVDGFKNVTIINSKENKGLSKSIISGVTSIIKKYGKVIVLEDDLITSDLFLEYMNRSLTIYQDREDIWSISGYTPTIKLPSNYKDEIFLIKRGASWGWATWENRWVLNDWEIKDYQAFKSNKKEVRLFNESGSDMAPMLNDQMLNRIDSWAIRWGYNQFKLNKWTIYPINSYIKNIGVDMSGTHSTLTNKYNSDLTNKMVKLPFKIEPNEQIIKEFKKLYDLKTLGYIALGIKKIGLYSPARKIRNKLLYLYSQFSN